MPIDYRIDHEQRLVVAEGRAMVTSDDVFQYQREVWSRSDLRGYDELIDMNQSDGVAPGPIRRTSALVEMSVASDPPDRWSRMAIVARSDEAFGIARQYQAYRQLHERSRKEVAVFRARIEAMRWLNDRKARDLGRFPGGSADSRD